MLRVLIILLLGISIVGVHVIRAESLISVKSTPPVVVKTFPEAGNTAVDPSIKEIRVTFSKDMMTEQMWSWVMASKDSFPVITGEVKYLDDKRT
ncbi:MAG: hypothetical protein GWN11_06565 [Candidatus Dadabacteria bacterium]|nr:hypothetical protein [Candidatus Dadabacteria bacterium]